jgi:class 3 adenylate cyclase
MRIGLEAGDVLVDVKRAARATDATGDAVNTAARLQTAAEPGIGRGPRRVRATKDDRVPGLERSR